CRSRASCSCEPPLNERVSLMRLEHRLDGRADRDRLSWITEQVADHPDPAGARQLDEDDDVRPGILERGMDGMPRALPAVDRAASLDRLPAEIEREARMTDPLGSPLPRAARATPLHAQ